MLVVFLERLALISALSILVLSILWPHISPVFLPFFAKYLFGPIKTLLKVGEDEVQNSFTDYVVIKEHPKFSGATLSVKTDGYGGGSRGQLGRRLGQNGNQSTAFTIFTSSIIALIIYTLVKMLKTRFGRQNIFKRRNSCKYFTKNKKETKDLRQDRKRLVRLTREERVRELILHHGGKNVSSAIKFLAAELERQKGQLFESLSESHSTCHCTCHSSSVLSEASYANQES